VLLLPPELLAPVPAAELLGPGSELSPHAVSDKANTSKPKLE
jgi:hypothetical protein